MTPGPRPSSTEVLFEPLPIGSLQSKNRIMRASTTTNLEGQAMVAHHARLAAGGVGSIVTGAFLPHPSQMRSSRGVPASDSKVIPGLVRLADAVHQHGAILIGQLAHSGRQHTSTTVPSHLVGPSAVACPRSGGVPHPLSREEVADLTKHFILASRNLDKAGIDGVELNGAQGHLLQQFLSPFSNRRNDPYGGSPSNRARLAIEILSGIREICSDGFVVGYRLGVDEFTDGGLTTDDTAAFATQLEEAGLIDYVSFSQGNFNSIAEHLPDRHYSPVPYAEVQAVVGRALTEVTRFACTRIRRPSEAAELITAGWADGVALGRALTVDPDWPNKAREGRVDEIRPCISCNYCWVGKHEGESSISCVLNPEVGRELVIRESNKVSTPRRVVVIGGGPGGLEASRTAASRGHQVVLFEQRDHLGGKAGRGGDIGGHTDFVDAAGWLSREVERLGVDVRLATTATVETVRAERPEVVVVATGATPVVPDVVSDGSVRALSSLEDVPSNGDGLQAVVVDEDGHYWAAQTVEELATRGFLVTLVTRFFEPFRELPIVSRIAALRTLDQAEVEVLPVHEVMALSDGGVELRHYDSKRQRRIENVYCVIWIGPQSPNDGVAAELREQLDGVDVRVIGDAVSPRRMHHAVLEGYDLARSI